MVQDKEIDLLFLEYLQEHFKDMPEADYKSLQMFLGPDNGANNPAYFAHLDRLYDKYKILKKLLPTVRTTAGLYNSPSRSNAGILKTWAVIMDFDYDRGEWSGASRKVQDTTLYEVCSWIAPSATVKTGHGWHLYWLLKSPIGGGQYAYLADLIRKQLKADFRSILPVQCMNFHNSDPRKPAVMVDRLTLESINAEVLTFPHNIQIYDADVLKHQVAGTSESEGIRLLRERQYEKRNIPMSDRMSDVRDEAMQLLEHFDIMLELNRAGYSAYSRPGGKIICSCPFHEDRHPSAYIDINPNSPYFGWLYCTSTHCLKHATLKTVLREIGVLV